MPDFDKVAFSLKTNELSEPVKTQYGWHIIKALSDMKPVADAAEGRQGADPAAAAPGEEQQGEHGLVEGDERRATTRSSTRSATRRPP